MPNALAQELRRLRREAGLSRTQLAINAGVSEKTLGRIEGSDSLGQVQTLELLAAAISRGRNGDLLGRYFALWDGREHRVAVSDDLAELLGYTTEELAAAGDLRLGADQSPERQARIRAALEKTGSCIMVTSLVRRDGGEVRFVYTMRAVPQTGGGVSYIGSGVPLEDGAGELAATLLELRERARRNRGRAAKRRLRT